MTPAGPLAATRCPVIGGAGAVGRMFVELLAGTGAAVCAAEQAGAGQKLREATSPRRTKAS